MNSHAGTCVELKPLKPWQWREDTAVRVLAQSRLNGAVGLDWPGRGGEE